MRAVAIRPEVVVRRAEHDRAVDLQQRLPILVRLLDVSVLHRPYALLGCHECVREGRVEHEPGAAVCPRAIGRLGSAGRLPREQEREVCLPVRGPRPAVEAVPIPHPVRAADVQVPASLSEQVDARPRHAPGQRAVRERRPCASSRSSFGASVSTSAANFGSISFPLGFPLFEPLSSWQSSAFSRVYESRRGRFHDVPLTFGNQTNL